MSSKQKLRKLRDRKNSVQFLVESKKNDFAIQLEQLLKQNNITQAGLARTLGTSAAYISKVLRGDANVTIETMVKMAHASGGEYHACITRKNTQIQWLGVVKTTTSARTTTSAVTKSKINTSITYEDNAA